MDKEKVDTFTYPSDPITNGREGVIAGRKYMGPAITHLLWNVRAGDELDVVTWGATTPDPSVSVTEWDVDEPLAVAEDGTEYRLWPRMVTPRDPTGTAWLRTTPENDSAGEMRAVWVVEKA